MEIEDIRFLMVYHEPKEEEIPKDLPPRLEWIMATPVMSSPCLQIKVNGEWINVRTDIEKMEIEE